jgi:HJR/Mrr/RecB family endonuclease
MPGLIAMIAYVFGILFSFWPILLLAPLGWGRVRNLMYAILSMWVFLFVGRMLALLVEPLPSLLGIPEPWNTIGFFVAGVVLFGIAYFSRRFERNKLIKTVDKVENAKELLDVSPAQFEKMTVELFQLAGHDAKRTGSIGDHGIDVVVNSKKGEKWVVQCKRWRGYVGEPIVRDFYGAMQHEKADRGIIITTGKFSKSAVEWAKGKPIALMNGDDFLNSWKRARQKIKNAMNSYKSSISS